MHSTPVLVEFDITPPVGIAMDGYAARPGNSLGIHDPLLWQLLLLQAGDCRLAFITLDLIGVSLHFTLQVRVGIYQVVGVPVDGTLIACSHTHSGAVGFLPHHPGIASFKDLELNQMVARKLVGAAIWAQQRLQPACLGVGRGSVAGIGLNRNDPESGLVDNEVILLYVADPSGVPLAVLMRPRLPSHCVGLPEPVLWGGLSRRSPFNPARRLSGYDFLIHKWRLRRCEHPLHAA